MSAVNGQEGHGVRQHIVSSMIQTIDRCRVYKMLKVHFQTFIVKNLIVMSVNRYFITICDDEKRRKLFGAFLFLD